MVGVDECGQIDLFAKDIILIPVNHNNSHWTGAAINFKKKRIESYDSMGMDRGTVYKVRLCNL
jgi:sentrin-specific protease 1